MAMSTDRVRFTITSSYSSKADITAKAAALAFGQPEGIIRNLMTCEGVIICRPSQFARFLIYRNEMGGANSFKELGAVLEPAEACGNLIDVSKSPARC